MNKVFFGFSGQPIAQEEKRFVIAESFECWNLKKMGFLEFVSELKSVIPPANANIVDKDYINGFGGRREDSKPIMPPIYDRCSWGLLLPTPNNPHRINVGMEEQFLFILNLFSPHFLHPLFTATEAGLEDQRQQLPRFWMDMNYTQDQSDKFKTPNFPIFYNKLLSLARFFYSSTDDIDHWNGENSLLGMACFLFDDLKKYHSKSPYTYHREYLDICVILETLLIQFKEPFNSLNASNKAQVLLGGKYPDAKACFAECYSERNKYVHGKTFKEIKRYSMNNVYSDSTIEYNDRHFKLTAKGQRYLRHLLTAYLYIYKKKKADKRLGNIKNLYLISNAAGNLYLRKRVKSSKKRKPDRYVRSALRQLSNEILNLMP